MAEPYANRTSSARQPDNSPLQARTRRSVSTEVVSMNKSPSPGSQASERYQMQGIPSPGYSSRPQYEFSRHRDRDEITKVEHNDIETKIARPAREDLEDRGVQKFELFNTNTPSRRPPLRDSSRSEPTRPSFVKDQLDTTPLRRLRLPLNSRVESSDLLQISPAKIDKRIEACIRKPLSSAQCESKELGNNYFFEAVTKDRPDETVMKIGSTKGPEKVRLDVITKRCQHLTAESQDDPEHMPIRLYKRAELLMHKELEDFRHSFKCPCPVQSHKEYFCVDRSVALEVMQRWREFCKREPYDDTGKLRPFWEHRLNNFRVAHDPELALDHQARARRWRTFMNPSRYSIFWYDLIRFFNRLWRWRWPAISLVQSFIIAILVLPEVYPVVIFGFMVAWVLLEMSDLDQPLFPSALLWTVDGHRLATTNEALPSFIAAARGAQIEEDHYPSSDYDEPEGDERG